jgi:hypothetical protein
MHVTVITGFLCPKIINEGLNKNEVIDKVS